MLRCGLNPEMVIWLPTTPSPEDHLRQYGLVDIALDPFLMEAAPHLVRHFGWEFLSLH